MSVSAILCTSCGASLEPKVLELKIKCNYCGTTFVIERDHDGVKGVSADGAPKPAGATPTTATPGAPVPASPLAGTPLAGLANMDAQTIDRLEKDALLVVRGLEAVERVAEGGVRRGGGCLVLFALALAGAVIAVVA